MRDLNTIFLKKFSYEDKFLARGSGTAGWVFALKTQAQDKVTALILCYPIAQLSRIMLGKG